MTKYGEHKKLPKGLSKIMICHLLYFIVFPSSALPCRPPSENYVGKRYKEGKTMDGKPKKYRKGNVE